MMSVNFILNGVRDFFKTMYEKMMIEERAIYLGRHKETKANGFYIRSLNSILGRFSEIAVPRTRDGNFRSALLPNGQSLEEIEILVNVLFKEGISTRKIESVLEKCFGTTLSHTTISRLALVAYEEVVRWRQRPLCNKYAVIFIDAFYFPVKRKTVEQEAIYVAMGITPTGQREILSFWMPGGSESSFNWEEIFEELASRGVKDVDYIVADGLTGISGAISRRFPSAKYQYCVLHAVRSCLAKVRACDKELMADQMKRIYKADNLEMALKALTEFKLRWEKIYPKVTTFWGENAKKLLAFMALPKQLWPHVYTTNCLERMHKEVKRRLKIMEQFQNVESAEKILYMLYSEQNKRYAKTGITQWTFSYKMYCEQTNKQEIKQEFSIEMAI